MGTVQADFLLYTDGIFLSAARERGGGERRGLAVRIEVQRKVEKIFMKAFEKLSNARRIPLFLLAQSLPHYAVVPVALFERVRLVAPSFVA